MARTPIRSRDGLSRAGRVVVKIGSAVLAPSGELDVGEVTRLSGELSAVIAGGVEVVLVSSGAVASGYRALGLKRRPRSIVEKQASAAVGQQRLMRAYAEAFGLGGRQVAQVLLTADDMENRRRFLNARRTLEELLVRGVVPIINENDSVSYDEIRLGDNDNLSALVASLLEAEALVILSSAPGVRAGGSGAVVPLVERIEDALVHVTGATSETGVGGMGTKILAARTAGAAGIPTLIAAGSTPGMTARALAGEEVGTFFVPRARAEAARKRWIGFSARPKGSILVDDGARAALAGRGASLLPSGVTSVRGEFEAGAPIEICGANGVAFARGIACYSAGEVRRIGGKKAAQIESILGYFYCEEVVHRNDLSLI